MAAAPGIKRGKSLADFLAGVVESAEREGAGYWALDGDAISAQIAADARFAAQLADQEREDEARRRKQEEEDAAYALVLSGGAAPAPVAAAPAPVAAAVAVAETDDERFARQLQEEEDRLARQRAKQVEEDEAYSKRIAEEQDIRTAPVKTAKKAQLKRPRDEEDDEEVRIAGDEETVVEVSKRASLVPVSTVGAKLAEGAMGELERALADTPVEVAAIARSVAALCKAVKGLRLRLIVNRDLCDRFAAFYYDLQERRGAGNEGMIIAYHGTAGCHLTGIADKGLVVPGTHGVKVAHGSAFGKGVYVTTQVPLAKSYASMHGPKTGGVVFVCAVLLGKQFLWNSGGNRDKKLRDGYDSNVVKGMRICVLFNEAQILPIYAASLGPTK